MRPSLSVLALALILTTAALAAATTELPLGATGPGFDLKGTDGKMYSLDQVKGPRGTAVIFTCNACPFSIGYEDRLIALANEYQPEGIAFIAINPNDPKIVPDDSFDKMIERAREKDLPYPYVFDATQKTAVAYGARVTPHIFLLDAAGKLAYRGRVDDNVNEGEVKARDFAEALAALATGRPIPVAETTAFGCGVKYAKK